METVVGIDLGTTNTVVAAVRGGRAEALRDVNGDTLIPSVVSFHPNGNVLVGRAAKDRRLVDAKNTIYSIKRLIGRTWDAEEVRLARPRFPFEMRQGPGQAPLVVARGESYTLGEISAFVLRKAKAVAEKALGSAVERTVITVPANFNDLQRAATKVAGRVAGLDVIRILNEPTAAALAYGYGKGPSGRIAVYDFGGGTFDVTLLDLSQNVFEVLATAGDTFLGGDDIDLVIAEHMADAFLAQHRIDPRTDPQSFERLRAGAEQIKIQLSTQERSTITLGEVAHGRAGASLDLTFAMTRADLDAIAVPFVDRTLEVCGRALSTAGLSVRDFGAVLLVGGSTRLTLVRRRVQEYFGRADFGSVNPDEVVAIGAALQAAALAGREQSEIPKPPALSRSSRSPARPLPPPVPPPPSFRERLASSADAVKAPETVGGLGARGRQRTKTGLGFAAQQAQAMELRDPPAFSPPPGVSAGREDLDPLEMALPLVGVAIPEGRSPTPPPEQNLSRRETTRKFGELPLIMPPDSPPREPARSGVTESSVARRVSDSIDESALPIPGVLPQLTEPEKRPASSPTAARPIAPPPPIPTRTAMLASPPVLVDVTPLTLSVETVGGFCDPIITRNTAVPCERTQEFATAIDNQSSVRVRISQGESSTFAQNTVLGEVELSGLRPAPRGAVRIAVTFALDADGILKVRARDLSTGRSAAAEIRLLAIPSADEVSAMATRQAGQVAF